MGTTGITNGCFDPIHIGHIYNLAVCKSKVDKLIVCLNSDASVRQLKGESRPFQLVHEREFALHSLKYVDDVYIFHDEEQLETIIFKHQPNFLFKGNEYQNKEITGQRIVERGRGKIEYIPHYGDWNSTGLIDLFMKIEGKIK